VLLTLLIHTSPNALNGAEEKGGKSQCVALCIFILSAKAGYGMSLMVLTYGAL
jgi:hypothetical protein